MPLVSVFEALAKMFFSSALAFNRSRLVRLFLIRYGELFPALPPPALQHQAAAFAAHSSAEAQIPPPFGLARLKGAFHHPFSEKNRYPLRERCRAGVYFLIASGVNRASVGGCATAAAAASLSGPHPVPR
jgi:hypothetical protein